MSFSNPLPAGIRQVVPDYVSDGVTLVYNFPFRLWAPPDLAVWVLPVGAAVWSPLVYGVDYTVAISGVTSASATLAVAKPAGALIRLLGLRTPSRTTSVVNDGSVQSVPFESELDLIEATMQELRRDANANAAAIAAETARAQSAEAAETGRAEGAEAALSASLATLAGLLASFGIASANFVTMRQAKSWLAANENSGQADIYLVDNAVPADIANAVTIQWRYGAIVQSGDALYAFIQTTLGLTAAQMTSAFAAMRSYAP